MSPLCWLPVRAVVYAAGVLQHTAWQQELQHQQSQTAAKESGGRARTHEETFQTQTVLSREALASCFPEG